MREQLATAGALLPLISLGVAGVSSGDIAVVVFVVGLIYFVWVGLGFFLMLARLGVKAVGERLRERREGGSAPSARSDVEDEIGFWIFYVAFLIALAVPIVAASVRPDGFERRANDFGYLHAGGILCVVIAALVIGARFSPRGRAKTQQCPDCAEKISAQAVKCKHCGRRLDPASSPGPVPRVS